MSSRKIIKNILVRSYNNYLSFITELNKTCDEYKNFDIQIQYSTIGHNGSSEYTALVTIYEVEDFSDLLKLI